MRPGAKLASPTTVPTISASSVSAVGSGGMASSSNSATQSPSSSIHQPAPIGSSSQKINSPSTSIGSLGAVNQSATGYRSGNQDSGKRLSGSSLQSPTQTSTSRQTRGIVNPIFVPDLVETNQLSSFPAPPPPPPPPLSLGSSASLLQKPHQRSNSTGSSSASSSTSNKSLQTLTTNGDSIHSSVAIGPLLNLKSLSPSSNQRTVITESSGIDSYQHHHNRSSSQNTSTKYLATIAELSQSSVSSANNPNRPHQHHQASDDCDHCNRYHANQHRRSRLSSASGSSPNHSPPLARTSPNLSQLPYYSRQRYPSPQYPSYQYPTHAPYPPQWYYLLGADSKQFRKHRHSHYHKDCKVCRQIVRQTFERYYLQQQPTLPSPSPSSYLTRSHSMGAATSVPRKSSRNSSEIDIIDGNSSPPLSMDPAGFYPSYVSLPQFPMTRSGRASCGHSCLKYTILFYCSVAVILAICFICYLTKMFGYLHQLPTIDYYHHNQNNNKYLNPHSPSPFTVNGTTTTALPTFNQTSNNSLMDVGGQTIPAPSVLQQFGFEIVGIVIASALMIIFFLGLIGSFLESVLCLRIFGAILSYLFLLTFGAAFYVIILLVISRVPAKLILSTVSCAAVTITIHASIAIAPFAFADLLFQEKEDEKAENSTYFKYPSVRFLQNSLGGGGASSRKSGRSSYFSLPFLGGGGYRGSNRSAAYVGPMSYPGGGGVVGGHMPAQHRHGTAAAMVAATNGNSNRRRNREVGPCSRSGSDGSGTNSINSNSSPRTSPLINNDNLSSEGLIPPISGNAGTSTGTNSNQVRFNDNWM